MTVLDLARVWIGQDPDERMRAELHELIVAAEAGDDLARADLEDAFRGPLEFGTAGLRGRLGPGPHRMNTVTVAQAAAGLAGFLTARGGGAVVIGHDARTDSDLFARTCAEILTGAGLSVMMLPGALPTPVLAFAVRQLGCAAGVMVTASHNPARDNGLKVYLDDGIQLVPPADAQISEHIAAVTASGPVTDLPRGTEWDTLGDEIVDRYIAKAASLIEPGPPLHLRMAYSPLHGVGGPVFLRALEEAGFPEPVVVAEQFDADPRFPTVPFPNPEEAGAVDMALALAEQATCDIAIVHDPDADRLAVAVPTSSGWRLLSGDEVGWLLAWWIAAGNRRLARDGAFAQSIVSGSMLEAIAAESHLRYVQTLTGFKWIARVPGLMFGYEEALGYCVDPNGVADKDGITAGLMVAEMAARLHSWHSSLPEVLDDLALQFGVHATRQVSVRVTDLAVIATVMASLRRQPPRSIAGIDVTAVDDLTLGKDGLPPTDALRFHLASGGRVIIRPSGTEPKVKCYLQAVRPPGEELAPARASAEAEVDAVASEVGTWLSDAG